MGLSTAISVEVESEMDLIDGFLADLVSENVVFVDDSLKVDSDVGFIKVLDREELHMDRLTKYKV